MGKRIYRLVYFTVEHFSPKMTTEWAVPYDGEPCVFVVNHAGALGPVDMCVKFPEREHCRIWMNADVLDRKLVPAYVRQDYWWKPGCLLEPLYNATLPYLAAAVLPAVLHDAPYVPVYHDMRVMQTMRESIRLLEQGTSLVIFPEQPSGWKSHHTWINTGFLKLCPMYARRSGKGLKLWPVHLDAKHHRFLVAPPVAYDPERSLEEQQDAIADSLAKGLRGEG